MINRLNKDMNPKRHQELIDLLSVQAQKVYDSIPISDAWSAGQIGAELRRKSFNFDPKSVLCHIHSCKDKGLVRESPSGKFSRIALKEGHESTVVALPNVVTAKPTVSTTKPSEPAVKEIALSDPIQKVAELAAGLRKTAAELTAQAASLDDLAIEWEERLAKIDADTEKFRQFTALMKSMGFGS